MKQPLGIVAVLYTAGLVLGNFLQPPLACLFAMSLALAAGALLLPRFRSFLIWPLLLFTGWTNFVWHTAVISPTDLRVALTGQPELVHVRGTLAATPVQRLYLGPAGESFSTTAPINVTEIQRGPNDWQPASGQIEATAGMLPANFFARQQVQVDGVLAPPAQPIAEGLFDFRTYLRRQEIYFVEKATRDGDWQIIGSRKLSRPLSDRFIAWTKTALALGQPPDSEPLHLEQALALGDKTYLTDQVTEPFVRASTYHIFAVDGLRLAILSGMILFILRALRLPRNLCALVLLPLIWSYVGLTGWPASAIRAAVMLTIIVFGWMLKRPGNVLNSLFAAALIILLWQPQQLFQAGFQLSFLVVLCILLVMPAFDRFAQRSLKTDPLLPDELRPRWQRISHRVLRFILGLFSSSLAAWLGSIPLVAYYFHILTPVSTPANVIAVPLCCLVLAANLTSLLLAGWLPAGAVFFNYLGWHLMEWLRASSAWFAGWPGAYTYVAAPNLFTIFLYYTIFLALASGWLSAPKWRKGKFTVLVLLLAIWCGQWVYHQSALRLTVLPLNGGSAIYCDAPGARNDLLIDCGNETSFEHVLKPYLRAQGVNSLPQFALTLGDARHAAGFPALQAILPIDKIITSSARFRFATYRDILPSLEKTPASRQRFHDGDAFASWAVLHPAATNQFPRGDDSALVLRTDIRGTRVLLLSDLGTAGQQALLERHPDLRADIVVAGLPGQNEPLTDALLAAINPQLIVIADSDFPVTRRAGRALRERLAKRGIPVLCTSDLGAVKISLRRNAWKAETVEGPSWSGNSKPL
jgi:competence protein ComEC